MKRPVGKALVLAICIAVMSIAGCGQQEPPSVKKSRATAAENMSLRKKLKQRGKEIEELKEQHHEEMKKQEEALAKCMEEKEAWKKKSQQNFRDQVKGVLDAVMEKNKKLHEEINELKAQIEKLKTELNERT